MRSRLAPQVASALSIAALLFGRVAAAADPFDARLAEARANEASADGQAYAPLFFEQFGPALQQSMQRCFPVPKGANPAAAHFTIVFAVHGDGAIGRALARPRSAGTDCVLASIAGVHVAAPPRPGWWMFVDMDVAP